MKSHRTFLPGLTAVLILAFSTGSSSAQGIYQFDTGYLVLDEENYPGITSSGYFSGTTALERDIAMDPVRSIVYLARGLANVNDANDKPAEQDGRPNGVAGPAAAVLSPFKGSNYRDTGLLISAPGSVPVSFQQSLYFDTVADKLFVFGGTNIFGEGTVTVEPTVYSAPGGSLGGAPLGSLPGAANPILRAEFKVLNDLNRGGSQRGIVSRTETIDGKTVTTVYVAMAHHVQAWRNDGTEFTANFPWRRLWATRRVPVQDIAYPSDDQRHSGSGAPVSGLAVDDEGNCYFSVSSTTPGRIWMVPRDAWSQASDRFNLDFDDRYFGGVNANPNARILPVVPRFPSPVLMVDGIDHWSRPQDLTFFRANGKKGLFVSIVKNPKRAVARLFLEDPSSDAYGSPVIRATIADAFGTAAAPNYQDSTLSTLRARGSADVTFPSGGTKTLLYTTVTTVTNPTHIWFSGFVKDAAKNQTVAYGTLGKVAIPSLPTQAFITGLSTNRGPTVGGTEVLITGSGFLPETVVAFGGEDPLSVKVESPTLIRTTIPPHPEGYAHVLVQNPGTSASYLSYGFSYVHVGDPFPLRIQPLSDGTMMLSWDSTAYREYEIWACGDLVKNDWILVDTVYSYSSYTSFIDSGITEIPVKFFRVVEVIP